MARSSLVEPQAPDPTAINLSALLSRLEQKLLNPDTKTRFAPTSSYDLKRIGANLEYARTLLLRLEHETPGIKVQSRKQKTQGRLSEQRELLKRLNDRLHELEQLDDDEYPEDEDGEDLLGELEKHAPDARDQAAKPGTNGHIAAHDLPSPDSPRSSTGNTDPSIIRARRPLPADPPDTGRTTGASNSSVAHTEKMMSHNRNEQETLTTSLLSMAEALKASSMLFHESLESEKEILNRAGEGLEKNTTGMEAAGKRMGALRRMAEGKGWWGRMLLYAWIFGLMLVAVSIVLFLPKLRF